MLSIADRQNLFSKLTPIIYVNDGDSFLATNGSQTGRTIMDFVRPQIPYPIIPYNISVPGTEINGRITNFSTTVTPLYDGVHIFVLHFMCGANNIRNGDSAATTFSLLQQYFSMAKGLGNLCYCLAGGNPLQCDISMSGTELPVFQTFNENVRQNWGISQGNGGLGVDGLVDYFSDPTVGAGNYVTSALCSSTYSPDGQHGNDLTKSILAPYQVSSFFNLITSLGYKH